MLRAAAAVLVSFGLGSGALTLLSGVLGAMAEPVALAVMAAGLVGGSVLQPHRAARPAHA